METSTAMQERREYPRVHPQAVDEDVIRAILEEARWAPSWANAQGWGVFVVTEDTLVSLKAGAASRAESNSSPVTDVKMPQRGEWPEHIQERDDLTAETSPAKRRHHRSDTGSGTSTARRCCCFSAAPASLAVEYARSDLGLFAENVCLAAADRGLGTCVMAMAVRYADVIHEIILRGVRFVVGIALGDPDWNDETNSVERTRCGFDESLAGSGRREHVRHGLKATSVGGRLPARDVRGLRR